MTDAEALVMLISNANDVARRFRQPPLTRDEEQSIKDTYWRYRTEDAERAKKAEGSS